MISVPLEIPWGSVGKVPAITADGWESKQGLSFGLPTEAQWEYAARNRGQLVVLATDNGTIDRGRNYSPSLHNPMEVGHFPPSPMGFYDLSGNAAEWVQDWYVEDYYKHSPVHDPRGPKMGRSKVYRGGVLLMIRVAAVQLRAEKQILCGRTIQDLAFAVQSTAISHYRLTSRAVSAKESLFWS